MDIRGHSFILVLLDYTTLRLSPYAQLMPGSLREVLLLLSQVGIAEEILMDQGSCFKSKVMAEMCRSLKVRQLWTSIYHPQTDGLVERFNQTLKQMLCKWIDVDGKNWDQLLPYVLFSIMEVPESSTGFSPFELLYGWRPRGMLDLAKEAWEEQPLPHRSVFEHMEQMQLRMAQVWPVVRGHMRKAQDAQARVYNRGPKVREFQPGEKVLVLVSMNDKFLAKWHGPYETVNRTGPVNYLIRQPGWHKSHQIDLNRCQFTEKVVGPWLHPAPCPLSQCLPSGTC